MIFVTYQKDVWESLGKLLAQPWQPTILYCPREDHDIYGDGGKEEFTERIKKLVTKAPGEIIDLVENRDRANKIKFIREHPTEVAAILTCGMFREGADWPPAARIIDLWPTSSDQDRNQRFGRLIRDYPGKRKIAYYSFFPAVDPNASKEEQRLQFSRLYSHFVASVILGSAILPAIPGRGHFWGLRPNPSGCFVKLQPEQMSLI